MSRVAKTLCVSRVANSKMKFTFMQKLHSDSLHSRWICTKVLIKANGLYEINIITNIIIIFIK